MRSWQWWSSQLHSVTASNGSVHFTLLCSQLLPLYNNICKLVIIAHCARNVSANFSFFPIIYSEDEDSVFFSDGHHSLSFPKDLVTWLLPWTSRSMVLLIYIFRMRLIIGRNNVMLDNITFIYLIRLVRTLSDFSTHLFCWWFIIKISLLLNKIFWWRNDEKLSNSSLRINICYRRQVQIIYVMPASPSLLYTLRIRKRAFENWHL